jgi:hypothetical protein
MFTRLSFTQAIAQLLAIAIDCVVGLLPPRRRSSDVRTKTPSRLLAPEHDDGRGMSPNRSPESQQEQTSVT